MVEGKEIYRDLWGSIEYFSGWNAYKIRRKTKDGEDILNLEIYVRISGG
jgi:hypothetical protein